jgi:colanic acid/amylovoran biosynthesis glycosyltransferase
VPRLVYLLKKFPRISETFVLNELLAQEALSRELAIFSRRAPDDEPRHPELARLKAPVEVMPPSKEIDPWTTLFGEGDDPEQLFAAVGRVVREARVWKHPRFGSLLAEALWLRTRCGELGVEHVHTHFATDSAVTAMLLRGLGGPSYSITAHAKDIYRSTVDPALLSLLFARSEFVVTVCDANVRHLESLLEPHSAAKVRRLYNGIDIEAFATANGAERDADHVLTVGRLVPKKGFDVFVEAIARLHAQGRTLRATIVGTGEDEPRIAALVAERGLSDVVTLAGSLPADEVRAVLGRATVFCLPCVIGPDGNRDALPTVLLEALAAGVPIVSTPVTGIPEILDHGRCGALVPENDAEATARAIAALLDAPERRERLATAGRAHAAQCFDLARQSRVLAGWFDEVLARREAECASPA